ncbi:MAG: methylated-DNA--[protein]-cysteine S-methyltransferase [Legionellaceae bacterium]|nr:methylated-DNA--[protein]-cysteine S-methyltransferase [Legionellaceae bacterium]
MLLKPLVSLTHITIPTPLGDMLAIADKSALCLLEFIGRRDLEANIKRLLNQTNTMLDNTSTPPLVSIKQELEAYFDGTLREFKTPVKTSGTVFQEQAWHALCRIPYGQTKSYLEQAQMINKPSACRAVARANSMNQLAIIIPCHRIIRSDNTLGGYAAGLLRKQALLEHEQVYIDKKQYSM